MSFLNPLFLVVLSALVIPVLIHLFNFRRYKKIYFTNVRFLAEIRQETRQRAQLRQLLILIARLLAVAALVIAFAQPYIPSPVPQQVQTGRKAVSVYIDNSFSMEGLTSSGTLLETAKEKALEIAAAYRPSDMFQLITNDFEGRHQSLVSRDEFNTLVEEVRISPVSRQMSKVLLRQIDALRNTGNLNKDIYLVSDFQRSTADLTSCSPDTSANYFFVRLQPESTDNLYIDSLWFDSPVMQPGQPSKLKALVRNSGRDLKDKIPLKVLINGQIKAVASITVAGGASAEVSLPFTNNDAGIQFGQVSLTDYPVVYDDALYFAYSLVNSIPVLCINGDQPNPYLEALFTYDSTFIFQNASSTRLDYSAFPRYSLIILNSLREISSGFAHELERYLSTGGQLVIFPDLTLDKESYRAFLSSVNAPWFTGSDTSHLRVDQVNLQSQVFSDVFERSSSGKVELPENADMPVVNWHLTLDRSAKGSAEPLMQLSNGDLFLASCETGKGKLYLFTSPLDENANNLPRHLVFVPLLYKIALLSQPKPRLYYFSGQNEPVEIRGDSTNDKTLYNIRANISGLEIIPEMRNTGNSVLLYPHGQITESGLYSIRRNQVLIAGAAFNYDRKESDLTFISSGEIKSAMKQKQVRYFTLLNETKAPLTRQIHELKQGRPLWKLFILLTLFFIAAEIAVIRFMK